MKKGTLLLALLLIAGLAFIVTAHYTRPPTFKQVAVDSGKWQQVISAADWEIRDSAEGAVFAGAMWLSGGYGEDGRPFRDLWCSMNGGQWEQALAQTPYDPYAELVVFKDRLWAIKQTVWVTGNGLRWSKVGGNTPFGERPYGEVVNWRGELWQLGSGPDVWASPDGFKWRCVQRNAAFGNRFASGVIAFKDRLWLIGGAVVSDNTSEHYDYLDDRNGIWTTADGRDWIKLGEAPWEPRLWSAVIEYQDWLYVIGGYANHDNQNLGDCWRTRDGVNWEPVSIVSGWEARHAPTVYNYQDKLWLMGGNSWPLNNDVWVLND